MYIFFNSSSWITARKDPFKASGHVKCVFSRDALSLNLYDYVPTCALDEMHVVLLLNAQHRSLRSNICRFLISFLREFWYMVNSGNRYSTSKHHAMSKLPFFGRYQLDNRYCFQIALFSSLLLNLTCCSEDDVVLS